MITFIRKATHHTTIRWATLLIALTVMATSLLQVAYITPAFASYTNTYPWNGAPCADSGSALGQTSGTGYWCTGYNWGENPCPSGDGFCSDANKLNGYYLYDKWGEGFRNCVSYTAWTLKQVYNIDTTSSNSNGWGNAADWNTNALAAGYTDDTSPQIGDIAQWNSPAPWGHVAYVYDVVNGVAKYAEYNHPQDGTYQDSLTSTTQGTPDKWIHIGTVSTPSDRPSAVTRDSSDTDAFYRNGTDNNLVDRYWNTTNGWNSVSWADNIASAPAGVARDSSHMDVLYRNTGNNLVDRYWNSTTGWNVTTIVANGTVRGNPTVIARSSSNLDVLYRDNSNNLVDAYWTPSGGWNTTYWADNIYSSGSPAALTRSSTSMDIFFRNSGNNLVDRYWSSSLGWNVATLVSNGTISSDPGVVDPDPNHMDAFYKDGTTGNLYDRWWDSSLGWNTSSWSLPAGSDAPAAVSRNSSSMEVFFKNPSNNLVDQWWNSSLGWNTATLDSSGTLTTAPSAIYRDSTDTDVFYGTSPANLADEYWNSTVGWNRTFWGW